jgi:hypothetical protein
MQSDSQPDDPPDSTALVPIRQFVIATVDEIVIALGGTDEAVLLARRALNAGVDRAVDVYSFQVRSGSTEDAAAALASEELSSETAYYICEIGKTRTVVSSNA